MATILRGNDNLDSSKVLSEELAGSIVTDANGVVTMPYQPAFFNSADVWSGTIFIGDTVNTENFNRGGHFNIGTGKFTAPVDGVYFFSFIVTSDTTDSHFVNIYKNGTQATRRAVLMYYNSYTTATTAITLQLSAGDYVEGRLRDTYSVYNANFSGYLIG